MYLGDFAEDGDIFFKFTTRIFATGIPGTLTGAPAILSVYIDEELTTELTTNETFFGMDIDFDSITGLNNVRIDLSGSAFFATGADYTVVITTGTVSGVSVVGEVVATFSIENRSMGQPAGATLAADLAAVKAETALIVADTNELQGDDIPTLIADVPTVSEFNARTLVSASYFDPAADTVATVTTVTNQITAATMADAIWDETLAGHVTADTAGLLLNDWQDAGRLDAILDIIAADVVNIDGIVPSAAGDAMTLTAAGVDLIWDETLAGHVTADTAGLLLNDWQNGGRLDLILDIIAVDTTTDIPALIATAQSDLDTITGSAGAIVDTGAASATALSDAIWDEDATAHQTQGTFGQAIGDPAADATTIYQAVATDAAGDNVAIDVIAVKAETALIVADTDVIDDGTSGLVKIASDVAAILIDTGTTLDGRIPAALVGGLMDSNVGAISADVAAANNLELFIEGTALGTLPQVDTQQINAANVVGDGNATPWDGA